LFRGNERRPMCIVRWRSRRWPRCGVAAAARGGRSSPESRGDGGGVERAGEARRARVRSGNERGWHGDGFYRARGDGAARERRQPAAEWDADVGKQVGLDASTGDGRWQILRRSGMVSAAMAVAVGWLEVGDDRRSPWVPPVSRREREGWEGGEVDLEGEGS
jgi:hypothetical protein